MIRISVKFDGSEYVVVVENERCGYRQMFGSYSPKAGPFGIKPEEVAAARQLAETDASDWAVKFLAAGMQAEVVS